jgi:hypothetical protein
MGTLKKLELKILGFTSQELNNVFEYIIFDLWEERKKITLS